jgi:hypothetical protein
VTAVCELLLKIIIGREAPQRFKKKFLGVFELTGEEQHLAAGIQYLRVIRSELERPVDCGEGILFAFGTEQRKSVSANVFSIFRRDSNCRFKELLGFFRLPVDEIDFGQFAVEDRIRRRQFESAFEEVAGNSVGLASLGEIIQMKPGVEPSLSRPDAQRRPARFSPAKGAKIRFLQKDPNVICGMSSVDIAAGVSRASVKRPKRR